MTAADAPAFHALVTDPAVARMLFMFPPEWTLDEALAFLDDWAWRGTLRFRLAIEGAEGWLGWIGVSDDPEPEIFYALRAGASGRGIAREAIAVFSAFLFDRFSCAALRAGVFTDNPASARALEACGFVRVGEGLHASRGRLAPAPAWVYRLERPGAVSAS